MNYDDKINAMLIGNVNTGKTTLFNWLTGKNRKEISDRNFAVSYQMANLKGSNGIIYDIPGISGLMIQNEEEKLAMDIIMNKDINTIIQVLDAKNIRRSLVLALQMAEFEIPLIFNINMVDEAQSRGIKIDSRKLGNKLGIKVNETIANEREGIGKLFSMINEGKVIRTPVSFNDRIEDAIRRIESLLEHSVFSRRALAILLIYKNNYIEEYIQKKFGGGVMEKCLKIVSDLERTNHKPPGLIMSEYYFSYANRLADLISNKVEIQKTPLRSAISRYTTGLIPGIPIAVIIGIAMFFFVGKFGAQVLVDLLDGKLFKGFIIPSAVNILKPLNNSLITDFFCGEFGIISVGLALSFGVVFPVLLTFYIFFGFLEDSGYMPRFSILLDKVFRRIGLNGKGVLPIMMGFSCITMAILTTRMLDTKKEKIIITMILILGIPCAPLLSVMFVLFGKLRWTAVLVVFGVILFQILLVGFILNLVLPGKRGDFIMEVPDIRMPLLLPIFKKAMLRIKSFLIEAVPIFLITSVILFIFDKLGGLNLLRIVFKPIVQSIFGLPGESVEVLVMTIIRREAGAALLNKYFESGIYNGLQTVVMMIIMTILIPCINSIIIMFKEYGLKTVLAAVGFALPYSFLIGAVVNFVLTVLKIKF